MKTQRTLLVFAALLLSLTLSSTACTSDVEVDSEIYLCTTDSDCAGLVCLAAPADPSTKICQSAGGLSLDCSPGCPNGAECAEGLCLNNAEGNCGWFRPGLDDSRPMCKIEKGSFIVGCISGEEHCTADAEFDQRISLTTNLYIDRYEVTNADYKKFLDHKAGESTTPPACQDGEDIWDRTNRSFPDGSDSNLSDHPVVCVTAITAAKYCEWAGKVLPTEAQWEAGARGDIGRVFPWGDTFEQGRAQCFNPMPCVTPPVINVASECTHVYSEGVCSVSLGGSGSCCLETAPVSAENESDGTAVTGLRHMAGNVAEWVADGWVGNHDGWRTSLADPFVPTDGKSERVAKGGSWTTPAWEIAGWGRQGFPANRGSREVGFRCAVSVPDQ